MTVQEFAMPETAEDNVRHNGAMMPRRAIEDSDRAAAAELADAVRKSGWNTSWRKVTSLLEEWGFNRLTDDARDRIGASLDEHFVVRPSLIEVERHETVRLSLREPNDSHARRVPVRATAWRPGQAPDAVAIDAIPDADGFLCLDVDADADMAEVFAILAPLCGGDLTLEMVDDLLSADPLPKVHRYSEDGRVRSVSAFSTEGVEWEGEGRTASKAGALQFGLVEFLANGKWLVTCCHRNKTYVGAREVADSAPTGCQALYEAVARRWMTGKGRTPGDLGVLMLHELAGSFSPTRRELESWLESWELNLYDARNVERETLIELRGLSAEFQKRLNALNVRRVEAPDAWFSGVTDEAVAERADDLVDNTRDDLREFSDALRGAFELLASERTAAQLELADEQSSAHERLQRKIELITSWFLVPTLIAGFFGANTYLPGGNGENSKPAFEVMIAAMVIGGAAVYLVLRHLRAQQDREVARCRAERARA